MHRRIEKISTATYHVDWHVLYFYFVEEQHRAGLCTERDNLAEKIGLTRFHRQNALKPLDEEVFSV